MDQIKPNDELREKIQAWIAEKKAFSPVKSDES